MAAEHVWRPARIGSLSIAHRIVMGSMHLGLERGDDGGAALAAFYRERARGGASLIVTGGWAVSRAGAGGPRYGMINEDAGARTLARAADAVHGEGGLICLQLFHAGRYAIPGAFGIQPVAPSPVYSRLSRCEPRELGGEEVAATIDDFASAAARARELGFDAVEVMGSEGYLVNQFLAPATNMRDDEWGGDEQRRMRFALEVVAAIRERAGAGMPLLFRISGADLVEGASTLRQTLALARALERGGVDALNVGIGWHESRVPTVQAIVPPGAWVGHARAIRGAVSIPVIASNRIHTIEHAEAVLAAGDADLVSMARPFLADPEIVAKARRGGGGVPVNRCIACNQACIDRSLFDERVSCVVNPRAGRELELGADGPQPIGGDAPGGGRRIAVIGAGPAGMEAARSLAARGHAVTLFEAGERIGGQFLLARRVPGKEVFADTVRYFEGELERLGVEVRLRTPLSAAAELEGFDGAVLAAGVVPRRPPLPGADLGHVVSYAELLRGDVEAGARVAIIGAGGIGVDVAHMLSSPRPPAADPVAEFLAEHGVTAPVPGRAGGSRGAAAPAQAPDRARDPAARGDAPREARAVAIMRRGARLGEGIGPSTRWAVVQALRGAGVEVLLSVRYERIEPHGVRIVDADGERRLVAADTVVIAAGQEANDGLRPQLERAGIPHTVIGGAAEAAELDAERAFAEGLAAGRAFDGAPGAVSR